MSTCYERYLIINSKNLYDYYFFIEDSFRSVPEEFRGIGIRIEDDILITDSGKCIYYSEELYKIGQDFLDMQVG